MKTYQSTKDSFIIFVAIILNIFGLIFSITDMLKYMEIFTIKTEPISLMIQIFSVHATMISLTIALISILSTTLKDEILGYPVTKFYFSDYRPVLKQNRIMIFLIVSVIMEYLFLAFELYNLMVTLFFTSLFLIILLIETNTRVLHGRELVESDYVNYIFYQIKKNGTINNLFESAKKNTDHIIEGDYILVSRNMNLLTKIFIEYKNNQKEIETKLNEEFESTLNALFTKMFESTEMFIMLGIDLLTEIIEKMINENTKVVISCLNLIEVQYWNLFKAIETFNNPEKIIRKLSHFRRVIYNQISRVGYNMTSMKHFSTAIYIKVKQNQKIESKSIYYEGLLNELAYDSNNENNHYSSRAKLELTELMRNMFYYFDTEYVNKYFVEEIAYKHDFQDDDIILNHSLLIYFFYLMEFEKLIDEEKRLKYKTSFGVISDLNYFSMITASNERLFNKSIYDGIEATVNWWEYFPGNGVVKDFVIESVVKIYYIINIIEFCSNEEEMKNCLRQSLPNMSISLIMRYKNMGYIKEKYKAFCTVFWKKDVDDLLIDLRITMLLRSLSEIAKEEKIAEVKRIYSLYELEKLENATKEKIKNEIESNLSIFSGRETSDNVIKLQIPITYTFSIFSNMTDHITDHIKKYAFNLCTENLIQRLQSNQKIELFEVDDYTKLVEGFIERKFNKDQYDVLIKTGHIIAYGAIYERLKDLSMNLSILNLDYSKTSRIIVMNKEGLKINSVSVTSLLSNVDIDVIIQQLKIDDEGNFIYPLTDEIDASFSKSELEYFLEMHRKTLNIVIEIEVQIADRCIGNGVYSLNIKK